MHKLFYAVIGYSTLSSFFLPRILKEEVLFIPLLSIVLATICMLIANRCIMRTGLVLFAAFLLLFATNGVTELLYEVAPEKQQRYRIQTLVTWRSLVAISMSVASVVILFRSFWKNKGNKAFLAIIGFSNLIALLMGIFVS